MTHDLVVRGGTVVDGSGLAKFSADVGVTNGRIAEIGRIRTNGRRELDASGLVVAPGFIDGHTHMDAQLFWDPIGSNSCWHGVTSVVMGNCGFTLAPSIRGKEDLVLRNLERAEDIPRSALDLGIPDWTWETFDEYLAAVDGAPKAINYASYVGHSALRSWAMGERAFEEQATEADVERMQHAMRAAMSAGAFGFSTTRSPEHQTAGGTPVASRLATWDEVDALVSVLDDFPTSVFQFTQNGTTTLDGGRRSEELETQLLRLAAHSSATVMFTVTGFQPDGQDVYDGLALVEAINGVGRAVGHTPVRDVCSLMSFRSRMPFDSVPEWREVRTLPLEEQRKLLNDPATRERLVAAAHHGSYGSGATITEASRPTDYRELLVLRQAVGVNASIGSLCGDADPVDFIIDQALASDFELIFEKQIANRDFGGTLDALRHPAIVIGASDAGAHISQICSAAIHTYLLAYWVRERQAISLETAVKMSTFDMACAWNVRDRGLIAAGLAADLVLFDPDVVAPLVPSYANDLPGGGLRLVQRSTGIAAVVVNGEVTQLDGEPTGATSGQVLRHASA